MSGGPRVPGPAGGRASAFLSLRRRQLGPGRRRGCGQRARLGPAAGGQVSSSREGRGTPGRRPVRELPHSLLPSRGLWAVTAQTAAARAVAVGAAVPGRADRYAGPPSAGHRRGSGPFASRGAAMKDAAGFPAVEGARKGGAPRRFSQALRCQSRRCL